MSHEVRMKPCYVPLWPSDRFWPGATLCWFQCNRKRGQLRFQSTSLDLPQEMHHELSVVRDVDVVMVFRHLSPKIGPCINPSVPLRKHCPHPTIPSLPHLEFLLFIILAMITNLVLDT